MPTGCDLSDLMGAGSRPTRVVSNWDSEAFSDRLVLLISPFFPCLLHFLPSHRLGLTLPPPPPSPTLSPPSNNPTTIWATS